MKAWLARYAMLPFEVIAVLWFAVGVGVACVGKKHGYFDPNIEYPLTQIFREIATSLDRATLLATWRSTGAVIVLGATLIALIVTARTGLSATRAWRACALLVAILGVFDAPALILVAAFVSKFLAGEPRISGDMISGAALLLAGLALLWVAASLRLLVSWTARQTIATST